MKCGIYSIENTKNNKRYIGQSSNIEKRIRGHFKKLKENIHDNPHLQASFLIYGEKCFISYIICECEKRDLDKLEKYYIFVYKTTNRKFGYNILEGGGGTRGRVVSSETRKKLAKAAAGRIYSEERNKKISLAKKGKPANITKTHREKITLSNSCKKIKTRPTTSKYFGVSYCTRDKSWSVYLKGKRIGVHKDETGAAMLFDKVSWETFHDLNKLNFPEDYLNQTINN